MNNTNSQENSSIGKLLYERLFKNKEGLIAFVILAVVILIILPSSLSAFRLNLAGKYLCYAFAAVGLVMCWGNAGILCLGQGLFLSLIHI